MSQAADTTGPQWPPSEFRLPLRKPVTDEAGSQIDHLDLREPTEDEWVETGKAEDGLERRKMVSLVCKLTMGTVAKITIGDLVIAETYFWAFFNLGRSLRPWLPPSSPTSTAGTPASSDD